MTRVSGPISVEVHWIECPAATDTFAMLNSLGIPYTARLVAAQSERRVLAKYGRMLMPTVLVWIGTGDRRHVYMSWEGLNQNAIRSTRRLIQDNALETT